MQSDVIKLNSREKPRQDPKTGDMLDKNKAYIKQSYLEIVWQPVQR